MNSTRSRRIRRIQGHIRHQPSKSPTPPQPHPPQPLTTKPNQHIGPTPTPQPQRQHIRPPIKHTKQQRLPPHTTATAPTKRHPPLKPLMQTPTTTTSPPTPTNPHPRQTAVRGACPRRAFRHRGEGRHELFEHLPAASSRRLRSFSNRKSICSSPSTTSVSGKFVCSCWMLVDPRTGRASVLGVAHRVCAPRIRGSCRTALCRVGRRSTLGCLAKRRAARSCAARTAG